MPFATIARRGCGASRTPGGFYAECGLGGGPNAKPVEYFLVDSPLLIPDGLDLVNKVQTWQDSRTGIYHLVIWIGEKWYPYVTDYIEEVRLFGASRRIPSTIDLSVLTPGRSRMIVAHAKARVENWHELTPPSRCRKHADGHEVEVVAGLLDDGKTVEGSVVGSEHALIPGYDLLVGKYGQTGPCLFKTYDLIPWDAGVVLYPTSETTNGKTTTIGCEDRVRTIADTSYAYTPTGEDATYAPAIFGALPLHGFSIVRDNEGKVNEKAEKKARESGFEWRVTDE